MVSIIIHWEESQRAEQECFGSWIEEGEHQLRMNVWEGGDGESLDFGSDQGGRREGQGGISSAQASQWHFAFYSCSSKPPLM